VNFLLLAFRNLSRNRFRVVLTILGVAVPVVAFVLLRTVLWSWELGSEVAAKDRVVTRHKITFIMTLPRRYVSDLEQHAAELGVKQTTFAVWFGGKDPAHEHEFLGSIAVDAKTYFDVYSEISLAPVQKQAWVQEFERAPSSAICWPRRCIGRSVTKSPFKATRIPRSPIGNSSSRAFMNRWPNPSIARASSSTTIT